MAYGRSQQFEFGASSPATPHSNSADALHEQHELQILCMVLHFLFENCFLKAILRFMDIYMNETDKERNGTP